MGSNSKIHQLAKGHPIEILLTPHRHPLLGYICVKYWVSEINGISPIIFGGNLVVVFTEKQSFDDLTLTLTFRVKGHRSKVVALIELYNMVCTLFTQDFSCSRYLTLKFGC